MISSNQISPGITIEISGKIFRVETCSKVNVAKGNPFIKTKLRDLVTDSIIEKNFKLKQEVKEVSLVEHTLEYLYPEGKNYLFLNIDNLEQILVDSNVLKKAIDFLKEGTQLKAMFYGESIFAVELPQFLELMVTNTKNIEDSKNLSSAIKKAVLETGAQIEVPLFIEIGDIVKVDTLTNEFIQRI